MLVNVCISTAASSLCCSQVLSRSGTAGGAILADEVSGAAGVPPWHDVDMACALKAHSITLNKVSGI